MQIAQCWLGSSRDDQGGLPVHRRAGGRAPRAVLPASAGPRDGRLPGAGDREAAAAGGRGGGRADPAGAKTELAKALARASGARMIRLQCYEGLDVSHAVYEWNYARQLLHIRAAQEGAVDEQELFGPGFLIRRPLLEAVEAEEPVVLL